jgi:hypothetical protein
MSTLSESLQKRDKITICTSIVTTVRTFLTSLPYTSVPPSVVSSDERMIFTINDTHSVLLSDVFFKESVLSLNTITVEKVGWGF